MFKCFITKKHLAHNLLVNSFLIGLRWECDSSLTVVSFKQVIAGWVWRLTPFPYLPTYSLHLPTALLPYPPTTYLLTYLSTHLPTYPPTTYSPTCLPTYLPTHLPPTHLPTHLPTYPPTYTTSLPAYLPTYLPPTHLPTHPPTYLPTHLHYLSTHPPTHLPTSADHWHRCTHTLRVFKYNRIPPSHPKSPGRAPRALAFTCKPWLLIPVLYL